MSIKSSRIQFVAAAFALWLTAGTSHAAFLGFASSPGTNSVDWTNAVTGLGSTINTNVNFDAVPLGVLPNNFYLGSDGVTLTPSDTSIDDVVTGSGPGQSNDFTTPLSNGEGLHAASNYLKSESTGGGTSSLIISFSAPVTGAGLFIVDYFGPNPQSFDNTLTLSAYAGQNGTGALLGSVNGEYFNFQRNFQYFMGVASTDGNIGSVVFSRSPDGSGDILGLDDIRFSTGVIPEPSSLAIAGIGLVGMAGAAIRRGRRQLA